MNTLPLPPGSNSPNASRFWQEWLGNSLFFPILNILLEVLVSDPVYYLLSPTLVSLLGASALQAWALSRWQEKQNPRRLLGNLIGPAAFTVVGLSLQGMEFLSAPNHIAYWGFGLLIGILQGIRTPVNVGLRALHVFATATARALMVFVMYYILHARLDPIQAMSVPDFLLYPANSFVVLAVLFLGLHTGFAELTAFGAEQRARAAAGKLTTYAAWLFGRNSQGQLNEEPAAPFAKRQERIILVMDLRGFARWSETRLPEETVNFINRYYQTTEATLNQHHALKFALRGGEVLAFFSQVDDGLQAALKLRLQINALLQRHGLGVGIGLHVGTVIEGWLGGKDIKVIDEVGEAVGIARQIESNAGPGELLVSEAMRIALGTTFRAGPKRFLPIANRDEPVVVYPLA